MGLGPERAGENKADKVDVGHTVVIRMSDRDYDETFRIRAAHEPREKGTIAPDSPVGEALKDRVVGETVTVEVDGNILEIKILEIAS